MKKGIIILLVFSSGFAHAQSLKDALFSGKLKNDPGTVIRKGDDLSTKIDTSSRKVNYDEASKARTAPMSLDSTSVKPGSGTDSVAVAKGANDRNEQVANPADAQATGTTTDAAAINSTSASAAAAPKNNNVLWKEYMDSVVSSLKTEALSNKKVKRGTYYATVSYTIETDGQVSVSDIFLTPENGYLQQQIKDRVSLSAPKLSPVLSSTGAPRKVIKKYNFTLTKE